MLPTPLLADGMAYHSTEELYSLLQKSRQSKDSPWVISNVKEVRHAVLSMDCEWLTCSRAHTHKPDTDCSQVAVARSSLDKGSIGALQANKATYPRRVFLLA